MRVSELVTIEQIKSWKSGDIITIKAGTGAGKSYFIKNNLYARAKKNKRKILFLIHRTNCVNQFQLEIEHDKKTDNIHIMTYQKLEAIYKNGGSFDFTPYKYIVCDEFHYFMSDASFNKTTDISLNRILEQNKKIRIFMSATGDYMTKYIRKYKKLNTKDYELPIDFSFIKELTFFNKDESLEKFIEEAIKKNHKGIFFIQSAKKAYNLYEKYKEHCLFNCSKSNADYYKYVDEEKINQMLLKEQFEEKILITTTCLDAGVNIIDPDLKHIVCDVNDTGTLIQCIGRKRLENKDDHIYLYIKTINNQTLGGFQTQLSKKLEMARFLRKHTVQEYIEKYPRDYDKWSIVYDDVVEGESDKGTKKVNDLMYFKCLTDGSEIDIMLSQGDFGYCKVIARKFGFYDEYDGYQYRVIEEEYENNQLETYLDNVVGKVMLNKSDRKELIEKVNVKQDGKLLKSLDSLNSALRERNIDFFIKQFETSRVLEGKKKKYKSAWKVMKLVEK
ncbi:DNA helicase [Heyndrickxia shackletonii]|uniref:DNA helicase n=1 Tax=Heyndrickxia shackletonii TaxID=157838 RepID=A0A0Q3WY10_9BACI|nr:DEAD/DEAH box helicase family protein [Heyndrickxia shackletonii]KQL54059.1 DNA helicase [Heyndrickxia shackletonii]NEZ02368.1 DEAD/DEAH box helicase family protein [Heyndrickxia shackletonii]